MAVIERRRKGLGWNLVGFFIIRSTGRVGAWAW